MALRSRTSRLAVVALPATILIGCANYSQVPKMNQVAMEGDDFNHQLARHYKDLANYEAYDMQDWRDAVAYADRAMAANAGTPGSPDDLSARRIKGGDKVAELQAARARLMQSLAAGAAQKSPVTAASAQSNFDCWAEQQEEGHQAAHIAACKEGFWNAMRATEVAMAPAPARQPPVAQRMTPAPAAPAAPQSRSYRVFFDWDSAVLTAEARRLLDQAVERHRASGQGIHLIGHADSSGPDTYNMRLSQRRADAVRNYLIANGVARNVITVEARGERDPLASAGDGVREPQNRAVAVNLFTRTSGV